MTGTNLIDPATLSGTELLLRQRYAKHTLLQEPLQASVSLAKSEALQGEGDQLKAAPGLPQKAVVMSNGRAGIMNIVMSADEYDESVIAKACQQFNTENRQAMSHSYQLPATYEGVPAGSWVFVEFEEL
ncbi:hypothetical protein [Pseudomonas ogarae]|uniref:hypothetical protein n=1 Tax=Pseudomonas ogarae (strain DSM 112162 / CECT 30235 / F113) TaxID=1114970 RepID=UPI001952745B|nr:hypothetical protein [Pseudomonas ogarae]